MKCKLNVVGFLNAACNLLSVVSEQSPLLVFLRCFLLRTVEFIGTDFCIYSLKIAVHCSKLNPELLR